MGKSILLWLFGIPIPIRPASAHRPWRVLVVEDQVLLSEVIAEGLAPL